MSRGVLLGSVLAALAFVAPGCSNGDGGADTGPAGDAYHRPDTGPCATNSDCPGSYCNPGNMHCCEPADPPYEICGDRIDQNCDMRDESCGDTDHDNVQACQAGENPLGGCDCDDERADVRPPRGAVAGAPEICDHIDNNCDGRIDEAAECCPACMALGADGASRADSCTTSGECDCTAEPGVGPCAAGLHCCSHGCVDVTSDVMNCGFCEAPCTVGSDRCVGSVCQCGDGPPCDFTGVCSGGACPMM
jgi:hypothetical protein